MTINKSDESHNKVSSSQLSLKDNDKKIISKEIIRSISNFIGSEIKVEYDKPTRSKIMVSPNKIEEIAIYLRDNYGLDHVESASGTDLPQNKEIEVNYHLNSYVNQDLFDYILNLSTRVNRDDPKTKSLINVFPSVEYFERETYEMLGVYFIGHPRNERFLLPEDWADLPPLRKDFKPRGK